jgi:hypothetical protein
LTVMVGLQAAGPGSSILSSHVVDPDSTFVFLVGSCIKCNNKSIFFCNSAPKYYLA